MRYRTALGSILLLTATLTGTHQAEAGLRFCNQANFKFSVAVGYVDREKGWVAKGWAQLEPGECKDGLGFPLDNRYYYFYATGHGEYANVKYTGETAFCIETRKFRVYQADYGKSGPEDCAKAGLRSERFMKIDVGTKPEFTVNLGDGSNPGVDAKSTRGSQPSAGGVDREPPPAASARRPAAVEEQPSTEYPRPRRLRASEPPPPAAASEQPPTAYADPPPPRRSRASEQPPPANAQPAPPAAQNGGGPNGTACQRYPNLC